MISGKPVKSSIERTSRPASIRPCAVPPVETSCTPRSDEAAGELDDAALVGDRQQRAADLHGPGSGELLGDFAGLDVGGVGDVAEHIARAAAAAPARVRRSADALAVDGLVAAVLDDAVVAGAAVDRVAPAGERR